MDNDLFLEARDAVARLELLSFAAETTTQTHAVKKEIERAKSVLNSAFEGSTPAEQDQIVHMQEHIDSLYDYYL